MTKKIILLACVMVILVSCSKANKISNNLPSYTKLSEIPDDYTLDDAKADGCVVFEDLKILSGEENWKEFLRLAKGGQSAKIRFVKLFSIDDSNLSIIDLSYDGTIYTLQEKDEETKQYKFLKHYTSDDNSLDYYILVNDEKVTFDELEKSLVSSKSDAYIDQYRIYINKLQ